MRAKSAITRMDERSGVTGPNFGLEGPLSLAANKKCFEERHDLWNAFLMLI